MSTSAARGSIVFEENYFVGTDSDNSHHSDYYGIRDTPGTSYLGFNTSVKGGNSVTSAKVVELTSGRRVFWVNKRGVCWVDSIRDELCVQEISIFPYASGDVSSLQCAECTAIIASLRLGEESFLYLHLHGIPRHLESIQVYRVQEQEQGGMIFVFVQDFPVDFLPLCADRFNLDDRTFLLVAAGEGALHTYEVNVSTGSLSRCNSGCTGGSPAESNADFRRKEAVKSHWSNQLGLLSSRPAVPVRMSVQERGHVSSHQVYCLSYSHVL